MASWVSRGHLSVVEVAEAEDLLVLVELVGHDLHPAHDRELAEVPRQLFLGRGGFGRQQVAVELVGQGGGLLRGAYQLDLQRCAGEASREDRVRQDSPEHVLL